MISLDVQARNIKEKPAALRKKGIIPAVYYGKKEASTPIAISAKEFGKVWKKAGESSVVTLKKDGDEFETLIHDVDLDPVTDEPRHADFYVFEKGQKLKINVPLEFVGVSPAVKDLGGILVKVLHEVEIEAAPKDLPRHIELDISPLATFESVLTARDLKLPAGVTLIEKPEEIVASVAVPKEESEEPEAPVDLSAIEVEKKGKKEVEGAEGAEAAKPEAKKEEKKK